MIFFLINWILLQNGKSKNITFKGHFNGPNHSEQGPLKETGPKVQGDTIGPTSFEIRGKNKFQERGAK